MNWRASRHGLIVRLVATSLLLLLVVQAAGFAVVRATLERNARSQIARELDVDENVWRRLLVQHAERLHQGAALLAADYGFRSAVGSGDQETIQSALENHGDRIGAGITALLDTQLNVRAVSMLPGLGDVHEALVQVLPALASDTGPASHVAVVGGLPYQFVLVPLKAPVLVGWVLMGFALEQPLAEEMRELLAVEVALRVRAADGTWSVAVSTLPAAPLVALQRHPGAVTELTGADGETLLARPVEIFRRVTAAAQADLPNFVALQQAFFYRAAKRCAVGDAFAKHVGVHIGVSVHMDHRHRAMRGIERAQDRQCNGVVAAERERDAARRDDGAVVLVDDLDRLLQVEGVDRHVTQIGHLQRVKRRGAGGHVVGADQAGFGADLAWAEAGTGAVAGADVQRHTDEACVQALWARRHGQTHHGGEAAKARHLVAALRLVESSGHELTCGGHATIPGSALAWW